MGGLRVQSWGLWLAVLGGPTFRPKKGSSERGKPLTKTTQQSSGLAEPLGTQAGALGKERHTLGVRVLRWVIPLPGGFGRGHNCYGSESHRRLRKQVRNF